MDFSEHPLDDADGVLLAHAIAVEGRVLKKGHRLDPETIELIRKEGRTSVLGARLGADDVHEDEAARLVAQAVAGPNARIARAFTGRVNLYAATRGLCRIDEALIKAINRVDEAITIATLAARGVARFQLKPMPTTGTSAAPKVPHPNAPRSATSRAFA